MRLTIVPMLVTLGLIVAAGDAARTDQAHNTLTAKEQAEHWRLLFDGKTTAGWRGYRQQTMPDGWKAVDGALTRIGTATDIITIDEFADFELTIDWNIAPNGNSGILYRVTEDDDVSWKTAPEFQVIDNAYKGLRPAQFAGSNYDLNPPSRDVTKPLPAGADHEHGDPLRQRRLAEADAGEQVQGSAALRQGEERSHRPAGSR